MDISGPLTVKVHLGDDIRRIPIHNNELTYDELFLMMQRVFKGKIEDNEFKIKYKDEDGDYITIINDSDLSCANHSNGVLEIKLLRLGSGEVASSIEASEVKLLCGEIQRLTDQVTEQNDRMADLSKLIQAIDVKQRKDLEYSKPTVQNNNLDMSRSSRSPSSMTGGPTAFEPSRRPDVVEQHDAFSGGQFKPENVVSSAPMSNSPSISGPPPPLPPTSLPPNNFSPASKMMYGDPAGPMPPAPPSGGPATGPGGPHMPPHGQQQQQHQHTPPSFGQFQPHGQQQQPGHPGAHHPQAGPPPPPASSASQQQGQQPSPMFGHQLPHQAMMYGPRPPMPQLAGSNQTPPPPSLQLGGPPPNTSAASGIYRPSSGAPPQAAAGGPPMPPVLGGPPQQQHPGPFGAGGPFAPPHSAQQPGMPPAQQPPAGYGQQYQTPMFMPYTPK